ncbi:hypothetical protein [uncultured Meiothermus sp.]|jgi:hypothetical protein|uniref:hypothetical protein n=1 Tax=uncultured Meiothermus sp. TaxID=157471 RepID=UPI002604F7B8|nr:hypothetical protein [uncultured Meiothermus sp.]
MEGKNNNAILGHLDMLAVRLNGSANRQRGVEWWSYGVGEGETLRVTYSYTPQGKHGVKTRDRGTFGAALEHTRQYFGEATITRLERGEVPLEEALSRLGKAAIIQSRPQFEQQIQRIADFSQRDAYVFIRMGDLEPFVQFGSVESLEGCLYLFRLEARPEAQPTAQPHAA